MSDNQRIRGLGGIKPSKMPPSASRGISVDEAEQRLGIAAVAVEIPATSTPASTLASNTESFHASNTASTLAAPAPEYQTLPESLLSRKPRLITVSRTFRLPLELINELEEVAEIHDIPMVTILAEALKLHLARFPRQPAAATQAPGFSSK